MPTHSHSRRADIPIAYRITQRTLKEEAKEDRRQKRKELARLVKKDRTMNADAAHELRLKQPQPPESAANGGGGAAESDDDLGEEFFK
jgi:hypothetical protein